MPVFAHNLIAYLFDNNGNFIGKDDSIIGNNTQVYASCTALVDGEALILGGSGNSTQVGHLIERFEVLFHNCFNILFYMIPYIISYEYDFDFKISIVSKCGISRLGDLPFNFNFGTCGTFMINKKPTIFLCFSPNGRECRTLEKRNNHLLRLFFK